MGGGVTYSDCVVTSCDVIPTPADVALETAEVLLLVDAEEGKTEVPGVGNPGALSVSSLLPIFVSASGVAEGDGTDAVGDCEETGNTSAEDPTDIAAEL